MRPKLTPQECRSKLIDTIQNEIIGNLKYRFNGYAYPFFFVKLDSRTVYRMVSDMACSTTSFGATLNEMRREFYMNRSEKGLIDVLWNAFWWPAVDSIWPLQCFSVVTEEDGVNGLYLLARTGPDEWVGVQTKQNFNQTEG